MDNKQLANHIFEKIREAAKNKSEINLTANEVEVLAGEIGNFRYVPVYKMEDVPRLIDEGVIKTQRHVSKNEQ